MSLPNRDIDPLYTSVTLIQYPGVEDHATGFYFRTNEQTYLITNQHVVDVQDSTGETIDSIRIFTREGPNELGNLKYHDVPLRDDDGRKTWFSHTEEPDIDIAAIPLDDVCDVEKEEMFPVAELGDESPKSGTFAFTSDNFLPDDVIVGAGERAMVMGYPVRGASPYFPVSRNALIATPFGAGIAFATDANMHPGTSGSPVLTLQKPILQTETGRVIGRDSGPFLIGIHSGDLNQFDDLNQLFRSGPLNLNTTWHVELLENICRD